MENEDFEPLDGVFAVPAPKDAPRYHVAALFYYCKARDVQPKELSQEERNLFIVRDNQPNLQDMTTKFDSLSVIECSDCGYEVLLNDLDPFLRYKSCLSCHSNRLIHRGMAHDVKVESLPDEEVNASDEVLSAEMIRRYEDGNVE